jgi:hypothetical protein
MTEQEFERLKQRFGADVSLWPAPYKQDGLRFLSDEQEPGEDDALDRLILDASQAATDEIALTRKVLASIGDDRKPAGALAGAWRLWTVPAAASGFAALLLIAAVSGYVAADRGIDETDDSLMALALGGGGFGDTGNGLFSEEDQL